METLGSRRTTSAWERSRPMTAEGARPVKVRPVWRSMSRQDAEESWTPAGRPAPAATPATAAPATAAPATASVPTPRLTSTSGTLRRWVWGTETGTDAGASAAAMGAAGTTGTGIGVDEEADATGAGSGKSAEKSLGMTSRPASLPASGAGVGAGTLGAACAAACLRCGRSPRGWSWAAAPPALELPARKARSSSRRRARVPASTFSAKTANLPDLSEGSTMKRTSGLPTKA